MCAAGDSITSRSYFSKWWEWRQTFACVTIHSQKTYSQLLVPLSRGWLNLASFGGQPKYGEYREGDFEEDPVIVKGRPRVCTVCLSPLFLQFSSSCLQSAPLMRSLSNDPIPGSQPSMINMRSPEERRTEVQQETNISEPGVNPAQCACTYCV